MKTHNYFSRNAYKLREEKHITANNSNLLRYDHVTQGNAAIGATCVTEARVGLWGS